MKISISMSNRNRKNAIEKLHDPIRPITDLVSQLYIFGNATGVHWQKELAAQLKNCSDYCSLVGGKLLKEEDIKSVLVPYTNSYRVFVRTELRSAATDIEYATLPKKRSWKSPPTEEDFIGVWRLVAKLTYKLSHSKIEKTYWEAAQEVIDYIENLPV